MISCSFPYSSLCDALRISCSKGGKGLHAQSRCLMASRWFSRLNLLICAAGQSSQAGEKRRGDVDPPSAHSGKGRRFQQHPAAQPGGMEMYPLHAAQIAVQNSMVHRGMMPMQSGLGGPHMMDGVGAASWILGGLDGDGQGHVSTPGRGRVFVRGRGDFRAGRWAPGHRLLAGTLPIAANLPIVATCPASRGRWSRAAGAGAVGACLTARGGRSGCGAEATKRSRRASTASCGLGRWPEGPGGRRWWFRRSRG